MYHKALEGIVIDQCQAMKNSLQLYSLKRDTGCVCDT